MAVIFAVILAVAGVWSSKRRPWKGGKDGAAVKAFTVTSLPFILAEAVTGVVSLLIGFLQIPPLFGLGTVVDKAILIVGVAVALRRSRVAGNEDEGRKTEER